MLPRIQAQEQIMAINAARLGSGWVDKKDARRALSRLERLAEGGRTKAVKASPDMLAAAGIAVIEVPPAVEGELKHV
ncbi:hypothetical protein CN180_13755 [Sinorhizobium medicae]|nr:hypothetical protein CN192_05980 [Sinorhizobium medicae]RVJ42348.1 hypothetical protein CN180_13755 [Sinorhizobium medicae]